MASTSTEPLFSVYENDPDVGEIVAVFVAEMPDRKAGLVRAVDAGDATEAARIAHQLKGASAGYGFGPLGVIAAAAEHALKDLQESGSPDPSAVHAAAATLIEACDRVRLASTETAA